MSSPGALPEQEAGRVSGAGRVHVGGQAPEAVPGPVGQRRGREAKESILTAAIDCLLEDGYAATTTLRVQQRAGVSRGKLLHHFPSKRELLAAATRKLTEDRLDAAAVEGAGGAEAPEANDLDARLEWMLRRLWSSFSLPTFWAAVETWIAARTDAELAEQIVDHEREVLRRVRAYAHELAGPCLSARLRFSEMLDLVFTSMRGMALTYSFSGRDPETEPLFDVWLTSARTLLEIGGDPDLA